MKTAILLILLFASFNIKAQLDINRTGDAYTIQYARIDATGNLSYARLGASTTQFSPTNPGNLVWYEYGDGKFTFQPSFVHAYHTNAYVANPFLKVTGVYETGGKPTRILPATSLPRNNAISGNFNYEANDPLVNSYNVKITSNVNAIRSNDTMHFAIDYRVPDNREGWRLVFEYNIGQSTCFKQTNPRKLIFDSYSEKLAVPFIRTHQGEIINNYYNRVVFERLEQTNFSKTVFVSLETLPDISEEDMEGTVTAYLINEKDKGINQGNQDMSNMRGIGNRPHDPNWVKVDKKCIKPNTLGMELNYHVRFQNTGIGHADDIVHVAIKLPQNISPALMNAATSNFQVDCSGVPMNTFSPYSHGVTTYGTFMPGVVYFDGTTHSDTLHFAIKRPATGTSFILKGMDSSKPNFMNDVQTMGNIKFKITLPSYTAPTDLYVQAAIVFDTEHSVLTEQEKTKVRKRCKRNRKPAECNCGLKQKKTFWQWIKENCN